MTHDTDTTATCEIYHSSNNLSKYDTVDYLHRCLRSYKTTFIQMKSFLLRWWCRNNHVCLYVQLLMWVAQVSTQVSTAAAYLWLSSRYGAKMRKLWLCAANISLRHIFHPHLKLPVARTRDTPQRYHLIVSLQTLNMENESACLYSNNMET